MLSKGANQGRRCVGQAFRRACLLGLVGWTLTTAWPAAAMELAITITGVRSTKGHVLIALYNNEADFLDTKKVVARMILPARQGAVSDRLVDLPPRAYAVSVLHDENDNEEMDFRFFMPREGYGFSNNIVPKFRAPKFPEAKFELGHEPMSITINMHYR